MHERRQQHGHPKFWLRRLVLLCALLAVAELLWVVFGANELFVLIAVVLAYGLVRLALYLRARSARKARVAERRRRTDPREPRSRARASTAEPDEWGWEEPRVARGRTR